jgi:hypothetical protein
MKPPVTLVVIVTTIVGCTSPSGHIHKDQCAPGPSLPRWGAVLPVASETDRSETEERLQSIVIPRIKLTNADLAVLSRWLTRESRRCDPTGLGVRIDRDEHDVALWGDEYRRRRLSCDLREIPLGEAVRLLGGALNCQYRIEGRRVILSARWAE